jgi:hypothetical protein
MEDHYLRFRFRDSGGSVRSDASDFGTQGGPFVPTIQILRYSPEHGRSLFALQISGLRGVRSSDASDFGSQGGPFVPTIQILRYSPGHGRSLFGEPTFLFVFR